MSQAARMQDELHAEPPVDLAKQPHVSADTDEIDHAALEAHAAAAQAARGRALYGEFTGQMQARQQATAEAAAQSNPHFLDLLAQQRAVAHNMQSVIAGALEADRRARAGARKRAEAIAAPRHGLSAAKQVADAGAGSAPQ